MSVHTVSGQSHHIRDVHNHVTNQVDCSYQGFRVLGFWAMLANTVENTVKYDAHTETVRDNYSEHTVKYDAHTETIRDNCSEHTVKLYGKKSLFTISANLGFRAKGKNNPEM
eukprot:3355313-Pyramimonas_sp.AAC.1